jgi:uncharacterized 2Fe-2S/4Fe-4S cluster protein (DUF4445 family)
MPGKVQITFEPSGTVTRVPEGTTLFHAAHWAGLPIDSTCGGRGTCGKCGVRLLEGTADVTPEDHRLLGDRVDQGWRLSCRCAVETPMVVDVPRPLRTPKAATMGVGRFVLLEPNVQRFVLELPPPDDDARDRLRRVREALEVEGLKVSHDADLLPRLAEVMGEEADRVTATVVGERLIDVEDGETGGRMHGVSIDLGTTTVVATLVDLTAGAVAAVASTINRQAPFGADVIARMGHAMTGPEAIEELRTAAVDTVNGLVDGVCAEAGVERDAIAEALLVGNATMLHLLLGVDPSSIALAPFAATFLDPQEMRASDAGIRIHPRGRLALFPSFGAYVGADLVADVLATGLARDPVRRLLIDVGTNGEIVCGSEERVVATAAPAGPAFEGGQIRCGMRATEGAIEGIDLSQGDVRLQVIGGDVAPAGLCGSGLVDAVAQLRAADVVTAAGLFRSSEDLRAAGHPLADRVVELDGGLKAFELAPDVVLTQLDVRELQSAKGAIATGIEVAMRALGWTTVDLDEVLLAGSFGSYIDPANARILGLVPPVPVERIRAVGNTASEGAKMALMSFREREVAFELPDVVEYLELSAQEDFNDLFIANLAFPALDAAEAVT